MEKQDVGSILWMGRLRPAVGAGARLLHGQGSWQGNSERTVLQQGAFDLLETRSVSLSAVS